MKKIILVLTILMLVSFSACGGNTESTNTESEDMSGEITDSVPAEQVSPINEKYINYAADISCKFMEAAQKEDQTAMMEAMEEARDYESYGLTAEEIQYYATEYESNQDFGLAAYAKMREICGDLIDELGVTEYAPQ